MPAEQSVGGEVDVGDRDGALKAALQLERVNTLELEIQGDLLRDAQRQLAQLNAELEAFTYSASHDLAVPLRTISAFAALLRESDDADLGPEATEYLDRIEGTAGRLEGLVSDMLVLSRMRSGADSRPERIDIGLVVDEIAEDLRLSGRKFSVEVGGPLPVVAAPPHRVRAILQNLVENAVKYNDNDPAAVSIIGDDGGSFVSLLVIDNGRGIARDDQEQIFELFARGGSSEGTTGTGAGLAIARRAARSMSGDLWLEDSSESGSTFVFTIPVIETPDARV